MKKTLANKLKVGVLAGAIAIGGLTYGAVKPDKAYAKEFNLSGGFIENRIIGEGINIIKENFGFGRRSTQRRIPPNIYKGEDGKFYPIEGYEWCKQNQNDGCTKPIRKIELINLETGENKIIHYNENEKASNKIRSYFEKLDVEGNFPIKGINVIKILKGKEVFNKNFKYNAERGAYTF